VSETNDKPRLIVPRVSIPTDVDFGGTTIRLLPNQALSLGPAELEAVAAAVPFDDLTPETLLMPSPPPPPPPPPKQKKPGKATAKKPDKPRPDGEPKKKGKSL